MHYKLTLKSGAVYTLDAEGCVTARTEGPQGWDYGRKWQVLGFATRYNARRIVSLADAADGAEIGQGWVHDLDHGTRRMWGGAGRRAASIRRCT